VLPYDGLNYHALLHMMSSSKEAVRPALPGKTKTIEQFKNKK
jgi:hypothetical protein